MKLLIHKKKCKIQINKIINTKATEIQNQIFDTRRLFDTKTKIINSNKKVT